MVHSGAELASLDLCQAPSLPKPEFCSLGLGCPQSAVGAWTLKLSLANFRESLYCWMLTSSWDPQVLPADIASAPSGASSSSVGPRCFTGCCGLYEVSSEVKISVSPSIPSSINHLDRDPEPSLEVLDSQYTLLTTFKRGAEYWVRFLLCPSPLFYLWSYRGR